MKLLFLIFPPIISIDDGKVLNWVCYHGAGKVLSRDNNQVIP